jgi:hypothetical protein
MRAIVRLGLKAIYLRQFLLALQAAISEKESRGHAHYGPTFTFQGV